MAYLQPNHRLRLQHALDHAHLLIPAESLFACMYLLIPAESLFSCMYTFPAATLAATQHCIMTKLASESTRGGHHYRWTAC